MQNGSYREIADISAKVVDFAWSPSISAGAPSNSAGAPSHEGRRYLFCPSILK